MSTLLMNTLKVMLCCAFSLFFQISLIFSQYAMEERYLEGMVNVERTSAGTLVIPHTLILGQSLYGISQFYDASLYDIMRFNPDLKIGEERTGTLIRVPIKKKHLITDLNDAYRYSLLEKVFYTVQKGDTPYGIAKRIFDIDVNEMLARNGITEKEVTAGSQLLVGWIPSVGLNYYGKPVKAKNVYYSPENEAFRSEFTSKGSGVSVKTIQEKGAAFWNKTAGEDFDYYVMHRKAPKNSIIEITNPDTGRTIYTKVIGKIPPKYPNKVIIVVSPKVAKEIGAINANFFVSLSYYK